MPYLENRPSRFWVKKEADLEDWMPMVLINPKIQLVKNVMLIWKVA
ncbi:MAG: hypothetical protein R3F23_02730 [Verrucomicrobiia bacterium]